MHQNSDPNISRYSSQQRKLNAVQPSARFAIKSNMNQQPRLTQNLQNFNTDKECDLNRPKIEISVIYNNMYYRINRLGYLGKTFNFPIKLLTMESHNCLIQMLPHASYCQAI